jgi:hypothetical protein
MVNLCIVRWCLLHLALPLLFVRAEGLGQDLYCGEGDALCRIVYA